MQTPLVTVNDEELLVEPLTLTVTLTAPAERAGTVAVMEVLDHAVTVALVPPKLTELEPWEEPKLVPVIVTADPAAPDVGLRELMLGVVVVPLEASRIPTSV